MIVLRNLDKDRGICNGCRCLVLQVSSRMLDVRVLTGRAAGQRVLLPRIPFRSGGSEFPFILRRRQFPVRLAWAMSIHKAQGQTLKRCGVYLPEPVFTHGQLYVCASRASSAQGLRFWLGIHGDGHGYQAVSDADDEQPHTHNIIYAAVLRMVNPAGPADDTVAAGFATPPAVPHEAAPTQHTEYVERTEAEEQAGEEP